MAMNFTVELSGTDVRVVIRRDEYERIGREIIEAVKEGCYNAALAVVDGGYGFQGLRTFVDLGWEQLNRGYAERKKGGDQSADLKLTGEMRNSLDVKRSPDGATISAIWYSAIHDLGIDPVPVRRWITSNYVEYARIVSEAILDSLRRLGGSIRT